MILVLMGPPGSGKGTQSQRLAARYGIPQLSTGSMLRAAVAEDSKLARIAQQTMVSGDLVSDELVIGIIADRIKRPDCVNGFVLDGFPRTLAQAEALDKMLTGRGMALDRAVNFDVPEEILFERIETRAEESDESRADDNAETLKHRIVVYHEQTRPIIEHYHTKGILMEVDGTLNVDRVTSSIFAILDESNSLAASAEADPNPSRNYLTHSAPAA